MCHLIMESQYVRETLLFALIVLQFKNSISTNVDFNILSIPDEQKLIMRLLNNYDPASRPVYNASKTVTINFGLSLIQLNDIDEKNQILTINVWLEQVIINLSKITLFKMYI